MRRSEGLKSEPIRSLLVLRGFGGLVQICLQWLYPVQICRIRFVNLQAFVNEKVSFGSFWF